MLLINQLNVKFEVTNLIKTKAIKVQKQIDLLSIKLFLACLHGRNRRADDMIGKET